VRWEMVQHPFLPDARLWILQGNLTWFVWTPTQKATMCGSYKICAKYISMVDWLFLEEKNQNVLVGLVRDLNKAIHDHKRFTGTNARHEDAASNAGFRSSASDVQQPMPTVSLIHRSHLS